MTKKLNVSLPLSTINKTLFRPHMDYGNVIYDHSNNYELSEIFDLLKRNISYMNFQRRIVPGIRHRIFERRNIAVRRLCCLHNVVSAKRFTYHCELIPRIVNSYRNPCFYRVLCCKTGLF